MQPDATLRFVKGSVLIISKHHDFIASGDQMVEVIFGAKSRVSTHIESFPPPPRKSPPKLNPLRAITFDDGSASDTQKFLAHPKHQFLENKISTPKF